MFRDFLYKSKIYLLLILLIFLIFVIISMTSFEFIKNIDNSFMNFMNNYIINDSLTTFFKIITNMGGVIFFVVFLIFMLIFIKDKSYFSWTSRTLITTYLLSVVLKNIFKRERPLINLIEKPYDYSFPSGHTMCSVAFYGFLIYLINRKVKNKIVRILLTILLSVILFIVSFSRLYLGVHYLSDVICGFIIGSICLIMFIHYVKIKEVF